YAIGFVGDFLVPKTVDSGATGPLWQALLVDLGLLTLFAVQHSGMARSAFKRWWTRFVPRPIERSTYVLFSSLVLALLFWQWRPLTAEIWSVEASWAQGLLWGLFALGWALVLVSTYLISHAHLFGLRQVYDHHRGRELSSPGFQTPSLYRHLRHPIMLGFLIAFWATPHMTAGHLLFAVASSGYILVGVALEERDLLRAFGERYRTYREQVPAFLPRIPGIPAADRTTSPAEDTGGG
ncbi:MAG: isoprenylcysteine carboxylmethyltransferase family protein, partial [Thermoanaerobaculia bacterium]|nr:isoprenylcysteine carboxylmethyltransferase family protein [Thermoanaerobaculia bacterium]